MRRASYGHQVSIRFAALELRKLDALVERAIAEDGRYPRKSRSSVILALVEREAKGLKLGPAERDERQLEMLEARSPLERDVDRVVKASKRVEAASPKRPRRKPKPSPKRGRR